MYLDVREERRRDERRVLPGVVGLVRVLPLEQQGLHVRKASGLGSLNTHTKSKRKRFDIGSGQIRPDKESTRPGPLGHAPHQKTRLPVARMQKQVR